MPRITHQDRRILEAVGERVRAARLQRGLSQEQLAEKLGITPETVSRYETGGLPLSLSMLHRVADVLDVEAVALFGTSSKKSREPEQELVSRWRLLDGDGQKLVIDLLRRLVR
ncbi:MAG: hypothetical protein AMXMBFR58_36540 [Phycisphaerae bacterium]